MSTTCGCGVKDSEVHGRYKTRMQPQRLSAGVLNHSSGNGKAKTPMENLCGVGCLQFFAGDYAAFFPKAFQVKAEVVSSQLERMVCPKCQEKWPYSTSAVSALRCLELVSCQGRRSEVLVVT